MMLLDGRNKDLKENILLRTSQSIISLISGLFSQVMMDLPELRNIILLDPYQALLIQSLLQEGSLKRLLFQLNLKNNLLLNMTPKLLQVIQIYLRIEK